MIPRAPTGLLLRYQVLPRPGWALDLGGGRARAGISRMEAERARAKLAAVAVALAAVSMITAVVCLPALSNPVRFWHSYNPQKNSRWSAIVRLSNVKY
jgi:hypothetical protein